MAKENVDTVAKTGNIENTVDNLISQVKTVGDDNFFTNLWNNYQGECLHFIKIFILTLVVVVVAWLLNKILTKLIIKSAEKLHAADNSLGDILSKIARVIIWVITGLIVLDLLGINTSGILAVLGACGLAVGLAMKDSLSNIASGLLLLFLRPYNVGDYIDCGATSGTIVKMGLFTTVLNTPDGLFISAPNSVLFGTPIKNYSRNQLRRSDITVGIAYSDSLSEGVAVLSRMLEENKLILKDPEPAVLVSELADSSVNLTLRYWTNTEDYWTVYWEIKNELKIRIEDAGLNIPFPQRVITFANPMPIGIEERK